MSENKKNETKKQKRLIMLKTAMEILDLKDYVALKKALQKENIQIISFGDLERVDLLDIERVIEQKKTPIAS